MKKRLISLILTLVMVFGTVSIGANADNSSKGKVHVTVENTTWKKTDKAPWDGVLVDKWISLESGDSMMSCVGKALKGYEDIQPDATYISKINGISEHDGGSQSGWMVSLNDWFTNEGIANYTVANNKLSDGDEICVQYTCNDFGADIGANYSNTSKALKALSFSSGTLSPEFNSSTHSYTLNLDAQTKEITVTPTAENKLFQVGTYVNGTQYKRSALVPVSDSTKIEIICGRADWPTMGQNTESEQIYTVTVKQKDAVPNAKVSIRSQMYGGYLHGLSAVDVKGSLAEAYGYKDNTDGVSALDALVKAHELVFGKDFTKDTAKSYLDVSEGGWVKKAFGSDEGFGFLLNAAYPNDGTKSEYGYNGTLINNTAVKNGDFIDFFIYGDTASYKDYYTWIDAADTFKEGENATVCVKGIEASNAYLYKDAAELRANAKGLSGVRLGWLAPETGAITEIDGAVTDENGAASFKINSSVATGYLVALSDINSQNAVYTVMNPTSKIEILSYAKVEFKGLHSAQLSDLKVYSYENGQKGETDFLENLSTEADGYKLKYTAKLIPGDYVAEGYDANGDFNGSIVINVPQDGGTFTLQRIYGIYASNSGWEVGTDYEITYKETAPDGTVRITKTGSANNYGTYYTSAIFLEGDAIDVTLSPLGEKAKSYLPAEIKKTGKQTVDSSAISLSAAIPEGLNINVTAPSGSVVTTGIFGNNYSYTFIDPISTAKNEDGTITAAFRVPTTNLNHFLRVQNPQGVTYWSFYKWKAPQDITVTRDDLHMDDDVTSLDVYRFQNNVYDRADIYLNINRQGYKNIALGESFELNTFRNWQAIENYTNSQIALPDTHYTVLDLDGKQSDILTVTPDAHNSALATVKANREGTAIVLVTYDAMTHKNGMSSTESKLFSAIWPECTGVFVVSVNANGEAITTNMVMDRTGSVGKLSDEKLALDAEHDILFYLGENGAEYTFTPESGCTVTVARSEIDGSLKFGGFTKSGITVDGTGAVTVSELTTGRHIIRIEKDNVATYQVITARRVQYDLTDANGNLLDDSTEFEPGDKVTVQFHNLLSPKEKLAGVYNHNFAVYYHDSGSHSFQSAAGGFGGMYDFNGNPQKQKLTVTIPEDATDFTYTLNGAIKIGGFGGIPTHRGVSYNNGMDRQWGTSAAGVLSRLPELTLKLKGYAVNNVQKLIEAIGTVNLSSESAILSAREAYDKLTAAQKEQVSDYGILTDAEAKLTELKKAEQEEIDKVIKAIDAIGTIDINSEDAILTARDAYNSLTDAQKLRVNNYKKLTDGEEKLTALKRSSLIESIYKVTGDYLAAAGTPKVGYVGGEWAVLGLARSGRTVPNGYYNNAIEYVRANADNNGRLHRSKSTDNSRLILALTAIGKDVTNVGGHNLLSGLYNMEYVKKQGINGPIFALLALDSHNYPTGGDVTREKLIKEILSAENAEGGWSISGGDSEVDITAMALQALAPYYSDKEVKSSVDKALTVLSNLQSPSGGFGTVTSEAAESSAQVLVALTALRLDPITDERFIKNGRTVPDALSDYFIPEGGFSHIEGGGRDGMATEQCYYALTAYMRFLENSNSLFNMSDIKISKAHPDNSDSSEKSEKPDNSGAKTDSGDKELPASDGDNSNNGGIAPKTGENRTVYLWITLSVLCGATALAFKKKKFLNR